MKALAVVPGRVELWLLSALAGEPAERLEQCLASGVLIVVDGGVAYRHGLAREAVQGTLPPDRRLALHRAALAALAAPAVGDGDPARVSYHAEAVGDADAVLEWAPRAAARAAGAGAHREAAAQYARVLRFSAGLTAEARAAFLERRSYECFLINDTDEAIASRQRCPVRVATRFVKRARQRAQQTTHPHRIAQPTTQIDRLLARRTERRDWREASVSPCRRAWT